MDSEWAGTTSKTCRDREIEEFPIYSTSSKREEFRRAGIELRRDWQLELIKKKKKKNGCALLLQLFWCLISFQILFPCLPSPPPKNYSATLNGLRRWSIGRLFDKRTMDDNTQALKVRRTCAQKRRRTSDMYLVWRKISTWQGQDCSMFSSKKARGREERTVWSGYSIQTTMWSLLAWRGGPYIHLKAGIDVTYLCWRLEAGPGVWREKTNISRQDWNGQEEAWSC